MRLKTFRLMAPAGEADGGGGDAEDVVVVDDRDATEETVDEKDRGDDLETPIDAKALKKVAGEDEPEGGQRIPIGRFNEVNEQKKALERRVAELEKSQPSPAPTTAPTEAPKPKFDEDKAEREYMTHLAEGEFDKAAAIRKEINSHIKAQAREEAVAESDQRQNMRETVQTLTQVASQAVKDWPYLDTEDGAGTMELIIAARDGFAAKGMPLAQALKKAVDQIAPKYAPEEAPGKGSSDAPARKDTREQQANARGAEASTRQPPKLDGGAGNRTQAGKVDVANLDDDQFNALSPAEKRKLRGDDA